MTLLQLLIFMLLIHFLADFGLQTHEQATKKGEGTSFFNKWLFYHVAVYTIVWGIAFIALPLSEVESPILRWVFFTTYVFVTHYITDWITSRMSKPFFSNGDFHNGFVVVGFDQLIHYLTLFPVLYLLVGLK